MLADDQSMETQLNSMWHKANVLKMPGQPLKDPLAVIAMEISCLPTYSPLRTILVAADEKLMIDTATSQVLIEERLRKIASTHLALDTKMTG